MKKSHVISNTCLRISTCTNVLQNEEFLREQDVLCDEVIREQDVLCDELIRQQDVLRDYEVICEQDMSRHEEVEHEQDVSSEKKKLSWLLVTISNIEYIRYSISLERI